MMQQLLCVRVVSGQLQSLLIDQSVHVITRMLQGQTYATSQLDAAL